MGAQHGVGESLEHTPIRFDYPQEGAEERGADPTQNMRRPPVLSHPALVPSLLTGFLDTFRIQR